MLFGSFWLPLLYFGVPRFALVCLVLVWHGLVWHSAHLVMQDQIDMFTGYLKVVFQERRVRDNTLHVNVDPLAM